MKMTIGKQFVASDEQLNDKATFDRGEERGKGDKHGRREIREHRDLHKKLFTDGRGKITAEIHGKPVHYIDEDYEFHTIDLSPEDKGEVIELNKNTFKSRFHKHMPKGKIFEMEKDKCKIELISKDIADGATVCTCGGSDDCTCENCTMHIDNATADTDIEYIVDAERIKENIIVKERKDKYEYNFEMALDNLAVSVSEDGSSLELTKKDSGTVQFIIPPPVMFDANGAQSDNVYYEIEQDSDDKLALKVIASAEWINAEDRAFPVTIDPQIKTVHRTGYYYGTSGYFGSPFRYSTHDFLHSNNLIDNKLYTCASMTEQKLITSRLFIDKSKVINSIGVSIDRIKNVKLYFKVNSDGDPVHINIGSQMYSFYKKDGWMQFELDITDVFFSSDDNTIQINFTPMGSTGGVSYGTVRFYLTNMAIQYETRLVNMTLVSPPKKTEYVPGETFDPTGMIIMGTYDDGSSRKISLSELDIEPSGALISGDTCIKFTHKEDGVSLTYNGISMDDSRFWFNDRRPVKGMENVFKVYEVDIDTGENISTEKYVRLELCDGAVGDAAGTPLNAETFNNLTLAAKNIRGIISEDNLPDYLRSENIKREPEQSETPQDSSESENSQESENTQANGTD